MTTFYKHLKRGTVYELVGVGMWLDINDCDRDDADVEVFERTPGLWMVLASDSYVTKFGKGEWARLQTSQNIHLGDVVAIYRDIKDRSLWVRLYSEFMDGRFERFDPEAEAWDHARETMLNASLDRKARGL